MKNPDDLLIAVGPEMAAAAKAARAAGGIEVVHCDDSVAAGEILASRFEPGDLCLIKGSRGMQF